MITALLESPAAVQEESELTPSQPVVRDPERFTGHKVRLEVFEGPLDLLLYLIRAHRYDIADIPIREATQQFMEFLRLMQEVDLIYAGDFLVTAATLMQIKSRMLLPAKESASEDEMVEEGGDPRTELVQRLLEYQRVQEAAGALKELGEARSQLFGRLPPGPGSGTDGLDDGDLEPMLSLQDVSSFDLLRALQRVLQRVTERPVALVRREPFTLGDRLRTLSQRLASSREPISFGGLCEDCESRVEVVITFLALLELIRRGRARVRQEALFDEIWISIG